MQELHIGLKEMYSQKVMPFLHSCLKEIIKTALDRYKQLGFLIQSSYTSAQGQPTTFLHSPGECKPKVQDLLSVLREHHTITENDYEVLFKEVEQCILRTQGPSPIANL